MHRNNRPHSRGAVRNPPKRTIMHTPIHGNSSGHADNDYDLEAATRGLAPQQGQDIELTTRGNDNTDDPLPSALGQGERRPPSLQKELTASKSGGFEIAQAVAGVAPRPDAEVFETAQSGLIPSAPTTTGKTSGAKALEKLHGDMRAVGCTLQELQAAVQALGGKYEPSKSAGLHLASLNDHVGIVNIPFNTRGTRIAENLAVIKDTVPPGPGETAPRELYFIKGFGNRLIGIGDLQAFEAKRPQYDVLVKKQGMETSFLAYLKECSSASSLFARRSHDESSHPVMPVPPNAMPMPLRRAWANGENYMAAGFGGHPTPPGQARASDFFLGYADYNAIENRLVIFLTDPDHHVTARPMQPRHGKEIPAALNIEGGVLAEIQGISTVEVMGPAGKTPGVKLSALRALLHNPEANMKLHITTEDGAIHELEYTARGLRMQLLQPKASGVGVMRPIATADVALYGYQGRNTGLYGSLSGYANPELILSTGEHLLAGPLLINRSGLEGKARALGNLAGNLVTLSATFGMTSARLTGAVNTTLRAASVAAVVYGMNAMVNAARDKDTHTLLGGAHAFSSTGYGTVTSSHLAGVVALTVVAQDVLTRVFDFAHKNLLKDAYKSRETIGGQIFNEAVLPLGSEFLRLVLNYGIQSGLKLPRGNAIDVATLAGVAALHTAVGFARGRSGESASHPAAEVVYNTIDFFVCDLLFRALGATAGSKQLKGEYSGLDYAEALLTRMATRGVDKWVAPILATALSAAGLLGPNARAYDDQVTQEDRYNGLVSYLRAFSATVSKVGTKVADKVEDVVKKDIEALAHTIHLAAVMVEHTNKSINRMGMDIRDPNPLELLAVQEASRFHEMNEDEQVAYLDGLTTRFEGMTQASLALQAQRENPVAPVELPAEGEAPPPPPVDTTLAVSNNRSQLPPEMERVMASLMDSFEETYAAGDNNYPTKVPPDFLSTSLPHFAQASAALGIKTDRLRRMITTFSDIPAEHIARIHHAMDAVKGMPEEPGDSNAAYTALTRPILRGIRNAVVKYTEESGPFHYLLRWPSTGQDHYVDIVPGVPMRVVMMNKRGNTQGDPDMQISGLDPLLINLGALHAKTFPAIVQRAVVSDARYLPLPEDQRRIGVITEGERVSLTEILSTTSAEQLAAAFLAALGYGAAANDRSLRIVIHQDSAVNIAKYTELMQAETISLPGGVFVVTRIDADPPVPAAATTGAATSTDNLGQVVYMARINTYDLETKYRDFQKAKESSERTGKPLVTTMQDGDLGIDPVSGHFFKYDAASQSMQFVIASKSYFLGTELETDQNQPARWRYPYTSPTSPGEVRRSIRAAILMDDPMTPYLNDAVRNTHHEVDRRNGGYYAENNVYRLEDEARLAAIRTAAEPAIRELNRLSMQEEFPAVALAKGQPFPGELLARLASTALMKPLLMLQVDADGNVQTEKVRSTDAEGNEVEKDEPVKLAHFVKTHDHFDMTWEPSGPSMIGVGPKGFYMMGYHEGELVAAPVQINGNGLSAGNLLHAIAASSYPNPNRERYVLKNGAVKSATAPQHSRMPGSFGTDEVNRSITQLLGKLKRFAASDYTDIRKWVGDTYSDLAGRGAQFSAPVPATTTATTTVPAES